MTSAPPNWARALLDVALPTGTRGRSVRADLDDEFREVAARSGARAARRWYGRQAVGIAAHFAWARVNEASITDAGGRGATMDRLMQNARLALRRFRRAPGFSLVAVMTIALGIGANVAIFSVVNGVILEPLPYDQPDELVAIWEWNIGRDHRENVANPGNLTAWRERTSAFARMSAVSLRQPATVLAAGEPAESMIQYAQSDFFEMLGARVALGRSFTPDLEAVETTEVLLSHRYWRQRFGGDPEVVGRTLLVNATPTVVVGVLAPDYIVFGEGTDLWASIALDRSDQTNSGRWLYVVGRLRAGTSLEVARDELEAVALGLAEEFPDFNSGWSVNPVPLKKQVVGSVERALWVLLGAVGVLLLIACANVANLFLVRATERQREMAVRASLGATRRALAGQLMIESMLIAGVGAAVGVCLAVLGTKALSTGLPDAFALPRIESATIDGPVLLFAICVTVATGLIFGLLPAAQAASGSSTGALNTEARGPSQRSIRVRDALVVSELALSVVLLTGAALFGRSFANLLAVDSGIESEHVLVGRVTLSGGRYDSDGDRVAYFDRLMQALAAQPGVEAVGGVTFLPMDGTGAATSQWPTDRPAPAPEDRRAADILNVSGDYFGAMGIRLLQGRTFDDRDRADAPQTIVVGRFLADQYWPGESAVGKRLIINWVHETPWEIVGVVEDVRMTGPETAARESIYIHYAAGAFFPWQQITLRGTGDATVLSSQLRRAVADLDVEIPIGDLRLMDDIVSRATARPRSTTVLMGVFAALATTLAAVGLYGVLAYAVSQRTREIGVRVAMGARPGDVVRMVLRQGSSLAVVGLGVGTLGALVAGRLLGVLLYEVRPSDPASLAASVAFLFLVAVCACTVPAFRAARVAPASALRAD